MKRLFLILAAALLLNGCHTLQKAFNRDHDEEYKPYTPNMTAPQPRPQAEAGFEVVDYPGIIPTVTFAKVAGGGQFGSRVVVYVRPNGTDEWLELVSTGSARVGQACYAYDLDGGFGPVVRFMNLDSLSKDPLRGAYGWPYYIYLVRPVQSLDALY
jgi:hypothetical protein